MTARKTLIASATQFGKRVWKVVVCCEEQITKWVNFTGQFLSRIWSCKFCIGIFTIVIFVLVVKLPILDSMKSNLSDLILQVWCWLQWAWCWLQMGQMREKIHNSEFARNIFLVAGGIFALIIAWWRSVIASSHRKSAIGQLKTAERARLDERFQNGAEMLGNDEFIVRMGGVAILERLSDEHAKEFHVEVVNLLVKFIKNPDVELLKSPALDLQEMLMAVSRRRKPEVDEYSKRFSTLVDISDSKLDYVNLYDATFCQFNFWNSKFRNADIRNSKFVDSHMSYTNFAEANLHYVNFSNSILRHTNFTHSNLRHVKFDNSRLFETDFTGAGLDNLILSSSSANLSIFDNATLSEAKLSGTSFKSASFVNSTLTHAILNNANLKGTDLSGADLSMADLSEADLRDANLSGADLDSADLTNTKLSNANLSGVANLTQAQLDSAFHGTGEPPNLDDPFRWDE